MVSRPNLAGRGAEVRIGLVGRSGAQLVTAVILQLFSAGIQFCIAHSPNGSVWRPACSEDHAGMDHALMDQRPSSQVAAAAGADTYDGEFASNQSRPSVEG